MKKLGRLCLITAILCLVVPLLAFAGSPIEITVSAAISLKNAFEEIGRLYESKYGIKSSPANIHVSQLIACDEGISIERSY